MKHLIEAREIKKHRDTLPALAFRTAWVKWLKSYGPGRFFDAFMRSAQNAESVCEQCGERIYLDIAEGGGVPDWCTTDGDYGCFYSPDTCEAGTGGHTPMKRR